MQVTPVPPSDRLRWIKSTASAAIPFEAAEMLLPYDRAPKPGDSVLVRVSKLGHMRVLENLRGCERPNYCPRELILGSLIWAVFGSRCGIRLGKVNVPTFAASTVHLHAQGGLVGMMEHHVVENQPPTEVQVLGYLGSSERQILNTREFGPDISAEPQEQGGRRTIIVVGSDTDAGKTQACRAIITALFKAGREVVAAKATGVAFAQDVALFYPQAHFVTDFVNHGVESTIGLGEHAAVSLFHRVRNELIANSGEQAVCVIELADGIINPETRAILADATVRETTTQVVFASAGVMAAMTGASILRQLGYEKPIFSGRLFNSGVGREQAIEHISPDVRYFNSGIEPEAELVKMFGLDD